MSTKRTNKKMLAARVLCTLLLGTYLVGGYGEPVAWGASATNASVNVSEDTSSNASSAWGKGTEASGDGSTAFGFATIARGDMSTAFGDQTRATGVGSTAFGWANTASGNYSTAFGFATIARGDGSTAFGFATIARGDMSTAFGESTTASVDYSTAFGKNTQAGQLLYGTEKIEATIERYEESDVTKYRIVNANLDASDPNYVLDNNNGTGFASYKAAYLDVDLTKAGTAATAFGLETTASGNASTAFGCDTKASGYYATAFGYETKAGAYASTAFGDNTNASGVDATAFGIETTASGVASTAFGRDTKASGYASTSFGLQTTASGYYATAFGYETKASSNSSTAFGRYTKASGNASTAFGIETTANVETSTAFGSNTQAGQLLYGTNKTEATIESYTEGSVTNYRIVDASDPSIILNDNGGTGFASYDEAYSVSSLTKAGTAATAFGYYTKATGDYSTAFGISSNAAAKNSLAALGGVTDEAATNSAAIGNGAKVTVADTVALGSGSVASRESGATDAYLKGSNTGNAWVSTHNAIAVGDDATVTRQITGVAAGSKDTDAVNVAQLKAAVSGGTVYEEGNGISFEDGNKIAVNADSNDFTFDSSGVLQLKKDGAVEENNQGVVTGSTVYSALNKKLDKTTFEAAKGQIEAAVADTANRIKAVEDADFGKSINELEDALDTKADKDMDNLTEAGKTVVKDLAKGAVNVVGDGPVSVAKSDVSGVDTYKVSVKTDGKVESGDTGIVTGGKVYDYLHGDTISLGKGSEATGTESIAIGYGNKVSGNNSGAFGDPNTVSGSGSYAIGNNNTISGDNTFVLGSNVKTGAKNAVVLGDGSEGADNAVSVGAKGKERQIKNVAAGTEDTDAATVGQLKALAGGTGASLDEVTRRISNVDNKVNKVGAGAAALAALHPMDTDGKFSMAAGFGNYRDANAMALGLFYRPNDQVMFSMGGSLGNGENLLNVGVSFALDKGVNTSKAAMAKKINVLEEENKAIRAENAEQKAEIQELKEALARIEAKLAK